MANRKKTERKKQNNKPAKNNVNKGGESVTKRTPPRYCPLSNNRQRGQSRKRQKLTKSAEPARPQNTSNTSDKNNSTLLSIKKKQEAEKTQSKSRISSALYIQCLSNRFNGGKREQKGATPTKARTQKRSKIAARKCT